MFYIILLSGLTVICLIIFVITNMVYSSLFKRTKRSVAADIEMLVSKNLITEDYYKRLPMENIKILSKDGITLNGYIIKNSNKSIGWVILCHGISSNHATLLSHVDFFMNYGFSVLLIDQRGHGQSGNAITTYGILEKQDISLWIGYIRKIYGAETLVGLMGHSMGASSALMTCSTEHKPNFIIAEAPFSNLKKLIKYNKEKKGYLTSLLEL
jgi:pimeloyl-ACP methyl ester carboxylesterase